MRDPRRLTAGYRSAIDGYVRSFRPDAPDDRTGVVRRLIETSVGTLARRVRSPLEALLGVRLLEALARRAAVAWDPRSDVRPDRCPVRPVRLCCNFRVDRFSFDFWIQADRDSSVDRRPAQVTLVECDGAAWHWGRQLDRDRRKDEFSAELGWQLFRLPSRRILRNPTGCAEEIVNYALDGYVQTPGVLDD